ncbi:MAG: AarF/UbiB family protein [Ketobacter sp.]|uniref:ABC1 kinase family protein n=1 Tax=Ketobacter sp. MCCC 1A13808 TaxID=2602738 RepID=UPI0018DC4F4D|nr:AarF/UbiB family protein [Ketobacter sp. MCCC 1A13808]
MDTTSTQPPRQDGLRVWLNVMNASLSALEQTVWQGRELAEQAVTAWKKLAQGAEGAREEYQAIAAQAAQWPERVQRMKQTGWMLTKVVGSYRLWGIRSAFIPHRKTERAFNKLHRKNARLFRDVSLTQGGAFLKVGQLLSARADILPKPWIEELRVLQDQAKPVPFSDIRSTIEAELQDTLENLFLSFDQQPIAAASIGQVHSAQLHDGRRVAVKVQRPGLEHIMDLDMGMLKLFANSIESMLPPTDLDTITGEIERSIREELDYRTEAKWMQQIADFLEPVNGVVVPHPIARYNTKKVLVSQFIDGTPLMTALDQRQADGDFAGVSDLLGRLLDLYLRQVLQSGVFQADPHPGNFLVTANNELVLLDFGCTMQLTDEFREGYFQVLGAALMGERDTMSTTLLKMGFKTRSGNPDTLLAFADALLSQIQKAAFKLSSEDGYWPTPAEIAAQAKELMMKAEADPVEKLPAEFIMLARVFTTLGGLFVHYKPKLDVNQYLFPHLVGPALSQAL